MSGSGLCFSSSISFRTMNGLENPMLAPMRVQNRSVKEARQAAMEMLDRLGIADLADH
ncbi:MAG: hypothetical protein ACOX52_13485 [Verrucomicrobiota bacterium]